MLSPSSFRLTTAGRAQTQRSPLGTVTNGPFRTNGSPLRRLGYERLMRNVAVALGNGRSSDAATDALRSRLGAVSAMVDEHIIWALHRLGASETSTIAPEEY